MNTFQRTLLTGAFLLAAALLAPTALAQPYCFLDDDGDGVEITTIDNDVFDGTGFISTDPPYLGSGARGTTGSTIRHHVFSVMSPDPGSDTDCVDEDLRFDWLMWNGRITGGGGGSFNWTGTFFSSCDAENGIGATSINGTITVGACPATRPDAPAVSPKVARAAEAAAAVKAGEVPARPAVSEPMLLEASTLGGGPQFCYTNDLEDQFQGTFVGSAQGYYGPGVLGGLDFIVHGGRGTTARERPNHTFTFQNPTAGDDPTCDSGNGERDWYTQTGIVSGSAPSYTFSAVELDACGGTGSVSGTITLGACPAPRPTASARSRSRTVAADAPAARASASSVAVTAGPNPFTSSTTILYALGEAAHVRLAVYDVLGREVAVLVDEPVESGQHSAIFEGANLPAGTYLYRLQAGSHVESNAITLVR